MSEGAPSPDLLLAAEVGKPHGIAGEVYVVRISDDPKRFQPGAVLQRPNGSQLTVRSARVHGERLLVSFDGIDDRDAAEELRGPLFVPAGSVRELAPDEFWHHELVGMSVVDDSGKAVGTVARVVEGAAQDLLEISTSDGIKLAPLVADIVVGIDRAARTVTVSPPPGLFE